MNARDLKKGELYIYSICCTERERGGEKTRTFLFNTVIMMVHCGHQSTNIKTEYDQERQL